MIWHHPDLHSRNFWLRIFLPAFLCVLVASPAASCSFVDAETAIRASIAEARLYWIGTALLVAAVFGLDLLEKRLSLDFAMGIAIVTLHPAWTVSPLFHSDCTFENVKASQLAAILLTSILVLRVYHYCRRRKALAAIGGSR